MIIVAVRKIDNDGVDGLMIDVPMRREGRAKSTFRPTSE
jgi:hypothetical protein